jgi:two-component system response regulator PrrA
MDELTARLRALLRRAAYHSEPAAGVDPPLRLGPLLVDSHAVVATWDRRDLRLTRRELALLETLARNPGVTLSRDRLLDLVWGYDFAPDSRALDVFISHLRRKLDTAGAPRILETVRGVGFVLRRP